MRATQPDRSQPLTGSTARKPRADPQTVENDRANISRAIIRAGQIFQRSQKPITGSIMEFVAKETGLSSEIITSRKKSDEKLRCAWESSKSFFSSRTSASSRIHSDNAESSVSMGFRAEGDFESICTSLSPATHHAPDSVASENGNKNSTSRKYETRSKQRSYQHSTIIEDNDTVISNLTEAIEHPEESHSNIEDQHEINRDEPTNHMDNEMGSINSNYDDEGSIYSPSNHSESVQPDQTRVQNLQIKNNSSTRHRHGRPSMPFSSPENIDNYQDNYEFDEGSNLGPFSQDRGNPGNSNTRERIRPQNTTATLPQNIEFNQGESGIYDGSQTGHDPIEVSGTQSTAPINRTTSLDDTTFEEIALLLAQAAPSMRFMPQDAIRAFRDVMTHILQQIIYGVRHNNDSIECALIGSVTSV